jgi:hypothetical protein
MSWKKFCNLFYQIEFFVFIILLSAIACYFPVLFGATGKSMQNPADISGHDLALQATAATIAISIPLLLESLMDINLPREITISRWMHITGLIIPNCLVMFQQDPIVYVSSGLARASILVGSLMLHMFNDPKLFTRARKLRYLSIFFALQICFQYRLYRICYPNLEFLNQISPIIIGAIGLTTLVIFIFTVMRFVTVDHAYDGGEKYCVYYSVGGVFAVIVYATYTVIMTIKGNYGVYLAGENLVATLVVESAFSTIASLIPSRIARHDRDQAEVCHLHSLDSLPLPVDLTSPSPHPL